ncbi:UDP-glucose 4-epimerase GalE [Petropleomorpha daqingensis]|uniref:UDP-glucose 4-epimerase n=1 Tax=Petropleomorpha daqingensis TaxID=2026353 RepID=A0A853CL40_9ACTN|nr:UDP-glucose 4-epimerase GalE [Petropleomorpha daqingensis]NYJ08287.1 UDP-glucose 4-epimerase [Petropleomorpha daqingensis]
MTGTWVVTGGAGYIGGHVVTALRREGIGVVVLDDLSTGRAERLPLDVPLVLGRVGDPQALRSVLAGATGVVHLAALTSAPESVRDPLAYYAANVTDTAMLLSAMAEAGVPRIVTSSSAAVYGCAPAGALTEQDQPRPQNPYGTTKWIAERLLAEVGAASGTASVALRFFNVVGAATPALADTRTSAVLPRLLDAAQGGTVTVHGLTHPTPDGSAVRDFVHVRDVAEAHVAAVRRLTCGGSGSAVYNVGTGWGCSVLELIDVVERVTGQPVRWIPGNVRPGDPARSVADPSLIARELGWRARFDLAEAVRSAWAARVPAAPAALTRRSLLPAAAG